MRRITVLTGSVSLFLLLAMFGAPFVAPVAASPVIRRVPTLEYPTIQAAVDAANPGDIIQVASRTYYEHVVVNKSLTLIGEGSSTTIIDGNGTGIVVRINAPDVEIRGFTVQNAGDSPNSSVLLGGCVRNTIRDNIIRNNAYGIALIRSNASIIVGNKIMNNSWAGIHIRDGSNNIIHYNTIVNNWMGVWITSESSLFNTFFHNNFIENNDHASSFAPTTKWDNGAEGNYWSDYVGADDNGDGIGDTGYPDPMFPRDKYPLMEPWSPYKVFNAGTWDGVTYYVTMFNNSTLASFNFSVPLRRISFNVTSGGFGFCNVTIPQTPKVLLGGYFTVLIDQEQAPILIITENDTHSSLYFAFGYGTHFVEVYGTTVIPEFSWGIPVLMLMVILAVLFMFSRRRGKDFR